MISPDAMDAPRVVTLLTDFGTKDTYVGIMKGVILSICRNIQLVDLTHDIPPQDVRIAAWQIHIAYRYFPSGTIHVAVVDPGVGTSRRPVVVACNGHLFVGPDNGLFTLLYQSGKPFEVYVLNQRIFFLDTISTTFHGRDIFAPVAGHLACGTPPGDMGVTITNPVSLAGMKPRVQEKMLQGQVVAIDRFGNVITNILEEEFKNFVKDKPFVIKAGSVCLKSLHMTYAEGAKRAIIAVIGSGGYLEVAEVTGSAAQKLNMGLGDPVTVSVEARR